MGSAPFLFSCPETRSGPTAFASRNSVCGGGSFAKTLPGVPALLVVCKWGACLQTLFYPLPEWYSKTGFHSNSFLTSENTCKKVLVGRFKAIFPVQTPFQVCSIYSLCFSPWQQVWGPDSVPAGISPPKWASNRGNSLQLLCVEHTPCTHYSSTFFRERNHLRFCTKCEISRSNFRWLFVLLYKQPRPIISQRQCSWLVLDLREFGPSCNCYIMYACNIVSMSLLVVWYCYRSLIVVCTYACECVCVCVWITLFWNCADSLYAPILYIHYLCVCRIPRNPTS